MCRLAVTAILTVKGSAQMRSYRRPRLASTQRPQYCTCPASQLPHAEGGAQLEWRTGVGAQDGAGLEVVRGDHAVAPAFGRGAEDGMGGQLACYSCRPAGLHSAQLAGDLFEVLKRGKMQCCNVCAVLPHAWPGCLRQRYAG